MNKKPTLYEILGVAKSASKDEIKTTYKKLALKYHPDRNPDNPIYEEHFKKINAAYHLLSDDKKKAAYDIKLNYSLSTHTVPVHMRQRYRYSYRKNIPISGTKQTIIIVGFFFTMILGSILLYHFMNNFSARRCYDEALELILKGETFTALGKLSEAIEFDDEYSEAYSKRGELLIITFNDFQSALYDFNNAIKFAQDTSALMFYKKGICNAKTGRYREAIIDFNRAILLDPEKSKTYYLRALSKFAIGDTADYCQDIKMAQQYGYIDAANILDIDCF